MHFLATSSLLLTAWSGLVASQTYTKCNPLQQTCPNDKALGGSFEANLASGASSGFTATSNYLTYDSNGASFSIRSQGNAPTLESNWYIMFGRVEVEMKASPGTGIVSTLVMQSDDLDEIDLEFVGGDATHVQSNYFGKGITGGYDRAETHSVPTAQSAFNTYTVDWSSEQIVWMINGQTVRVLKYANAPSGQYPQSPMQIKIGSWAGGDPSNSPGTISWAGGQTDYSQGPFVMQVKSIKVQDYSTGTEYKYGDHSGSWQSIQAIGGSVHAGGSSSGTDTSAPATTQQVTSGQPSPFSGTHAQGTSGRVTPTIYPWVSSNTMATSASPAASCYTGRPDGWTCSDTGKLLPPSSAVSTRVPSSTHSAQASHSASLSTGTSTAASQVTAAPVAPPASSYVGAAATAAYGHAAVLIGGLAGVAALL